MFNFVLFLVKAMCGAKRLGLVGEIERSWDLCILSIDSKKYCH